MEPNAALGDEEVSEIKKYWITAGEPGVDITLADEDDDEEEEDPRDTLVRRLLEHKKFQAAAELLHEKETLRSAEWIRPDDRVADIADEPFQRELEVDLFRLNLSHTSLDRFEEYVLCKPEIKT